MVRFRSLSLRRSASILLMECSTVVWCLPPNWRPISGSDAEVSCFTRYMAIWRGKGDGLGVGAHLQVLIAQAELFADTLLDQLDGDLLFLRGDDVAQNLLRGGQIERPPVSEA